MSVYELLNKVQVGLVAPKNQYNAFGKYKYRSCEDILEGAKSLLKELNCVIVISDSIEMISDRIYVKSTARFVDCKSGDHVETVAYARESLSKKGMDDSQVTGATSSYSRKYALNGLLLVDDTKDTDSLDNSNEDKKDEGNGEPNDPSKKDDKKPWLNDISKLVAHAKEQKLSIPDTLAKGREIYKISKDTAKKIEAELAKS